jgi:hypothetical protein
MTIGTILPGILAECGIDNVTPVVNDTSFEMRQILALMNAAGADINTRAEWTGTVAETSTTDISFPPVGVPYVDLPADFQELAETGAVMLGGYDYKPVRPVVSPEMWQLLEKIPSTQPYYHLKNGRIYFLPRIDTNGVTIRYVSKNWLVGKALITSNDDVTVFPERLLTRATIWRWKRQKGLAYDDVLAEFEADLQTAINADRGLA